MINTPLTVHAQIPAILISTLCYSFWLSFNRIGSHTVQPTTWPLIWLGFNTFMLCNPLPIYHRSSRVWLIKRFARLLVSGLTRVEVRAHRSSSELVWTHFTLSSLISGWGSSALLPVLPPFLLMLMVPLDTFTGTRYAASTSH